MKLLMTEILFNS